MTTEKEILELLRSGKDVTAIGDEFAAMLNKANNTYQAEQRAKAEEENKVASLIPIINQFIEWYEYYYEPLEQTLDLKELAQGIIESIGLIDSVGNIYEDLFTQMESNKNRRGGSDDFFGLVKKFLS